MVGRLAHYFFHASELFFIFQMQKEYKQFRSTDLRLIDISHNYNDIDYCFEALKKVSRSFSIVIQQLPDELKLLSAYII